MTPQEQITARYEAYIREALALEAAGHPWDGVLGFGTRPADDPCHTRFVEELVTQTRALREAGISAGEALDAVETILFAPLDHRDPASVYWTLIAAQGAALDLIPLMDPGERAKTCARFCAQFPRPQRLPVQKYVLEALKKA